MQIDKRLEIIAPKWYRRIIKAKTYRQILKPKKISAFDSLDLSQYGSCVIGESHGFSENYSTQDHNKIENKNNVLSGCPECTKYAQAIYEKNPNRSTGRRFKDAIDSYIQHVKYGHGVNLEVVS